MPKRPRQHQLENESRIAFQASLPAGWIYREETPDYGVDASVEVFDEAGNSTGLRFFVQLKATDGELSDKSPVRIRRSTGDYYSSLDVPVLIVQYSSPTKVLRGRWFHEFDPYYEAGGEKWLNFRLSPDNEVNNTKWEKLLQDLTVIRQLVRREIILPIVFGFSSEITEVCGHPVSLIEITLREFLAPFNEVVQLRKAEEAIGSLRCTHSEIRAQLTTKFYATSPTQPNLSPECVGSNLAILMAVCLAQATLVQPACRLILERIKDSSLSEFPATAGILVGIVAAAGRVEEALSLVEFFDDQDEENLEVLLLESNVLFDAGKFSRRERDLVVSFYRRRAVELERKGEHTRAATRYYNLGNHHSSQGEYRYAVRGYKLAGRLDPTYRERDYFWRELAGVLFHAGRFKASANSYRRALQLREVAEWHALLGDSLLFAGELKDASEELIKYHKAVENPKAEFCLLAFAIEYIRAITEIDKQQRQARLAQASVKFDEPQAPNEVKSILRYDALCAPAWFNLAKWFVLEGDDRGAAQAILAAAITCPSEPDYWCNAILYSTCFLPEAPGMVSAVVETAYRRHGQVIVRSITERAKEAGVPHWKDLMEDMAAMVRGLSRYGEEVPRELRLLGEGPSYSSIIRKPDGSIQVLDWAGPSDQNLNKVGGK